MATNNVSLNVRVDKDIKEQCSNLYGDLGITLSAAINIFLRKSLQTGGFPFEVTGEKVGAVKEKKTAKEGYSF